MNDIYQKKYMERHIEEHCSTIYFNRINGKHVLQQYASLFIKVTLAYKHTINTYITPSQLWLTGHILHVK